CSLPICYSSAAKPQLEDRQRVKIPEDTPADNTGVPDCPPNRSIQPALRCDDTLEWLGDNVKHRLLSLNQSINAILKCVGRRIIGNPELLLGRFVGCFVLLRIIIKRFLLRCNRILD